VSNDHLSSYAHPLAREIKLALVCDALKLACVDARRLEAARKAQRRASRVRLLQPAPARGPPPAPARRPAEGDAAATRAMAQDAADRR
jgi:hypothetical protein